MEEASQDSKSTDFGHLHLILLSSSTKRRGTGLASLHQQILQSGRNGESRFAEIADRLQNYQKIPAPRPSKFSS